MHVYSYILHVPNMTFKLLRPDHFLMITIYQESTQGGLFKQTRTWSDSPVFCSVNKFA